MAQRGQPQTSLRVASDVHHNQMIIDGRDDSMELQGDRVEPSKAIAIGTYPDMTVAPFGQRHDSGGDITIKMLRRHVLGRETVESALVGAYPAIAIPINQGADDTGITNNITHAQLVAHIAETIGSDRLFVDTLLKQAEPEITAAILNDGIDLAPGQIDLHAIERVVGELLVCGIIESNTLTVVADDDMAFTIAIEGRDTMSVGALNMFGAVAIEQEDTGIGGTYIDMSCLILDDSAGQESGLVGQIALHLLAVIAEEIFIIDNHPETAFFVLYHAIDGMQVCQGTAHLTGMCLVRELHHAQT